MGRWSRFDRIPNDLYPTIDDRAFDPLVPFLLRDGIKTYAEPCWGLGHLEKGFQRFGLTCVSRSDIDPPEADDPDLCFPVADTVHRLDGRFLTRDGLNGADAIITNPPWSRDVLHELIPLWAGFATTWLLFDAAWKNNGRTVPHLIEKHCTDFVPLPRLKWFGGQHTAARDCGWYRFCAQGSPSGLRFWPRGAVPKLEGAA
jgi:hypothetical protein